VTRAAAIAGLFAALSCAQLRDADVEGVGTLEYVEADVETAISARVIRVDVREGDHVRVGDTVAVLSIATLGAEFAQARANEALARAVLSEMEAGARAREIERAEAELTAREANVRRLADDSTRLAPLVAQDMAPAAQLVAARNAVLTAVGERDAATAALRLLREGTRPERIAAGRADVERARAQFAAAQAIADDLVLLSSVDGMVVARNAEPGEVLAPGRSVATIAESRRPWVRVYLGPQHVPLIHVGDTVEARLDAFPDRRFAGRVTAIATRAEYTPRVALTEAERADLLFGVRVDFDDSTGMLKAGLPITVRFARRTP
jgi:HlyD family secretion protein